MYLITVDHQSKNDQVKQPSSQRAVKPEPAREGKKEASEARGETPPTGRDE